jgi:hypothetical protein
MAAAQHVLLNKRIDVLIPPQAASWLQACPAPLQPCFSSGAGICVGMVHGTCGRVQVSWRCMHAQRMWGSEDFVTAIDRSRRSWGGRWMCGRP